MKHLPRFRSLNDDQLSETTFETMSIVNPAAALFDKHAANYMHKYMDVGLYADSLRHFAALLPAALTCWNWDAVLAT